MIELYNTFSRKKEDFVEIEKGVVKIYSCGPTVYSYQHIGNMRAALFSDFLKRTLRYFGYEVIDVINITDVGHLSSDADDGEDKMLKASKKEKKDPYEIAKFYTEAYIEDLKKLNIILPKFMPKATENINEQIEIVKKLEEDGFTYKTDDGVYFDVSKFSDYGELSGQSLEEKKAGARVEVDSLKKNPQDFALWKFLTKENLGHIMKWDSPWGVGFPGWHLECSAMSSRFLGKRFDIHTGGIDHVPVHHENEIAQNKCSHVVDRINFWMHNYHMLVDGEKMSKSVGNVYILSDLLEKGYCPLALREICLRTHYRKQMNFTFESLDSGQSNVRKINEFYLKLKNQKPSDENGNGIEKLYSNCIKIFEDALKDDLNTSVALSALDEFMNEINKKENLSKTEIIVALKFLEETNKVLGLLEFNDKIPQDIIDIAKRRKFVRDKRDFVLSDKLRHEINKGGYDIKDSDETKEGFILSKL